MYLFILFHFRQMAESTFMQSDLLCELYCLAAGHVNSDSQVTGPGVTEPLCCVAIRGTRRSALLGAKPMETFHSGVLRYIQQ